MNVIFEGYLLKITVFLVMGRSVEHTEEKKKTDKKTLKNEEIEKRRIRGKSNNNNIHLWFSIIFCSKT